MPRLPRSLPRKMERAVRTVMRKCKVQSAKCKVQNATWRATSAFHFSFITFHFSFCTFAGLASAEDAPPKLVGSSSCATAACHGGLTDHKFVGAEFPIWSARDPHARAYSVLRNELSRQMAEQLKLSQPAHESAECLNCHSPATSAETKLATISGRRPLDGVDCEQCHGPAERWLTPHVR